MKKNKRYANILLCAALSLTLLTGCSSTALPISMPEDFLSSARTIRNSIEQYIGNLTGSTADGDSAQNQDQTDNSDQTQESESSGSDNQNTGNSGENQENSGLYYYYNQLSDEQKDLYNTLLKVTENPQDNSSGQTVRLSVDPESDEFSQMYHVVYGALVSDHPELFWLTQGDSGFTYSYPRIASLTGHYPVTITLRTSYSDAPQMISQLESAASDLLAQVDLSREAPQVALQIHDRLIDLVQYDTAVAEQGGHDLAHTAYGALVADSSGNANRAVCDGYTYAYEYLLQQAGIECAVVNGSAGPDESRAQSHSWLCVNLGGQWYETDPTWDDIDPSGSTQADYYQLQAQALSDSAYMGKLRHYLYDVTTQEMSSFTPDDRYVYRTSEGWVSFLTSSVHIRNRAGDEDETGDYTTPLAPTADGTQYTYSNLTGN